LGNVRRHRAATSRHPPAPCTPSSGSTQYMRTPPAARIWLSSHTVAGGCPLPAAQSYHRRPSEASNSGCGWLPRRRRRPASPASRPSGPVASVRRGERTIASAAAPDRRLRARGLIAPAAAIMRGACGGSASRRQA
jgi:hypothetical protein